MKRILILLLIIIIVISISGRSNYPFKNDRNFYIIILGGTHEGELGYMVPTTRICQLVNSPKDKYSLKDIQVFENNECISVNMYYDYGFFRINTRDDYDQMFYDINLIPKNEPWKRVTYKRISILEDISPINQHGKNSLIAYKFNEINNNFETRLFNVDSFEKPKEISSNILKSIMIVNDLLTIKDRNKMILKRWGIGEFVVPYTPPPMEILNNVTRLLVVLNSDNYLVLKPHYFPTEKESGEQILFILNKTTKRWLKKLVGGTETSIYPVSNNVVCRVGNRSPEGPNYPSIFSGKWIIIDIPNNKQHIVNFNPSSKILHIGNDYIIARDLTKLLYIGQINGKFSITNAITIYEDNKNDLNTTNEVVGYIDAVFFGP